MYVHVREDFAASSVAKVLPVYAASSKATLDSPPLPSKNYANLFRLLTVLKVSVVLMLSTLILAPLRVNSSERLILKSEWLPAILVRLSMYNVFVAMLSVCPFFEAWFFIITALIRFVVHHQVITAQIQILQRRHCDERKRYCASTYCCAAA